MGVKRLSRLHGQARSYSGNHFKVARSPRMRSESPPRRCGAGRLYNEGTSLKQRRKAFMEEVMNLEQAALRQKAKELMHQSSHLYQQRELLGKFAKFGRPAISKERRTSTERRYPGRLCGPPSESPSPRSPRSPSSSRCPKCSEPEVKDDSSQTTQASSASLPLETTELELLKKQLGLLSMGAEMLRRRLEEAQRAQERALSERAQEGAPDPSPRSPCRRPGGVQAVQSASSLLPRQGEEPRTAIRQIPGTPCGASPVFWRVEHGGGLVRCMAPATVLTANPQVQPVFAPRAMPQAGIMRKPA